MKFINGMKDLSQAIVDKTVDVSQKSFKWVKDNRVEIIEYAAITILKSVVEVLNEDRNRKEIYENEYDYNESFESNINESSYISTINDEQVVLKEPQIKNNKNYPHVDKSFIPAWFLIRGDLRNNYHGKPLYGVIKTDKYIRDNKIDCIDMNSDFFKDIIQYKKLYFLKEWI